MRYAARSALLFAVLCWASPATAQDPTPRVLSGADIEQRLNEAVPLDLTFRDETGRTVQLRDYFGDKPVVLSLVYFKCPMLCTLVLNGLVRSLRATEFEPG